MKLLAGYLAVGIGGFLGAIARYFVGSVCGRIFGTTFPVGTMIINLSGSFILGWFLTSIGQRAMVSDAMRLAVAVGFVGAYTTFSTYVYESNGLLQDGSEIKATINLVGSVLLGLIAVRLGMFLGARI
jgi:fluoride exporter